MFEGIDKSGYFQLARLFKVLDSWANGWCGHKKSFAIIVFLKIFFASFNIKLLLYSYLWDKWVNINFFVFESCFVKTLKCFFIIRTSWLYSKEFGHNFYKTILEKTNTEKELTITDAQIGCPTNTENLSEFIYRFILEQSNNFGIKHFCDKFKFRLRKI